MTRRSCCATCAATTGSRPACTTRATSTRPSTRRTSRGVADGRRARVLDVFEQVFRHAEFTGRSGSFFAYEGLGSIYWHMVSKLLLAVQENHERAVAEGADAAVVAGLADAYEDIRLGLGYCKTPEVYGAFPVDPYSHTPGRQGRPAARHDRPGQGGDPHPARRAGAAGRGRPRRRAARAAAGRRVDHDPDDVHATTTSPSRRGASRSPPARSRSRSARCRWSTGAPTDAARR